MKKNKLSLLMMAVAGGVGTALGAYCMKSKTGKTSSGKDKHWYYYECLNRWLELKNKNHALKEYFEQQGYEEIAVYGGGQLGLRLWEELVNTDIKIKYAIDSSTCFLDGIVNVYSPDDDLEKVDAIIVTPIHAFDSIKEKLEQKINVPIISIEEVVDEIEI